MTEPLIRCAACNGVNIQSRGWAWYDANTCIIVDDDPESLDGIDGGWCEDCDGPRDFKVSTVTPAERDAALAHRANGREVIR